MQKQSFGNGYGLNRKIPGSKAMPAAEPPMANPIVRPGVHNSRKHFDGAKIYTNKINVEPRFRKS